MDQDVSIARLEEKLDRVLDYIEKQDGHNKNFYDVRDAVIKLEAKSSGAWAVLVTFGSIVVAAAGVVAKYFGGKG